MTGENKPWMRAVQELRKGSRTTPIPSKKRYKRKPKHRRERDDRT